MNDCRIIRQAALELHATDDNNIVKIAGIISRIRNYIATWGDPAAAKIREKIKTEGIRVKEKMDRLNDAVGELNKAIENVDTNAYGPALELVKRLIPELAVELNNINKSTTQAITETPTAVVNEQGKVFPDARVDAFQKGKPDPELAQEFKASWEDVPKSQAARGRNLQDFPHYHQFSVDKIIVRPAVINNLVTQLKNVSDRRGVISEELSQKLFEDSSQKEAIAHDFKIAVLNSKFLSGPGEPRIRTSTINKDRSKDMEATVFIDNFYLPNSLEILGKPLFYDFVVDFQDFSQTSNKPFLIISSTTRHTLSSQTPVSHEEAAQSKGPYLERIAPPIVAFSDEVGFYKKALTNQINLQPTQPKGAALPDHFWDKFVQMCQRLRVSPYELAAVINKESGFNPAAYPGTPQRPIAQGLNQLIRHTAVNSLKMSPQTWQHLGKMPAEQQLGWTELYFQRVGAAGKNAGQLYLKNFGGFPNPDGSLYAGKAAQAAWIAAHPEDAGKFQRSDFQELAIQQNSGLVRNGKIMPGTVTALVSGGIKGPIREKIDAAVARVGNAPPPPFTPPDPNWIPSGIQEMPAQSSYVAQTPTSAPVTQPVAPEGQQMYDSLMRVLMAGNITRIVKSAMSQSILPTTRALVVVDQNIELPFRVRYAHLLSSALREEIDADVSLHYGNNEIQLECDVVGSEDNVIRAINGLADGISNAFEMATGQMVRSAIFSGQSSKYGILDSESSETNFRKFAILMAGRDA